MMTTVSLLSFYPPLTKGSAADAQAVFEKVVSKLSGKEVQPLLDVWTEYQYEYQMLDGIFLTQETLKKIFGNGNCDSYFCVSY